MKMSRFVRPAAVLAALVSLTPVRADELQSLPLATPAPDSASATLNRPAPLAPDVNVPGAAPAPTITRIASTVSTYIERGVVMVPLRPLAQFLRLRVRNVLGVTIVEKVAADGATPAIRLMFRSGSTKAQIERNGVTCGINLPIPTQTRLGNTFVPARATSAVFGATAQSVPKEKAILLNFERRSGLFSSIASNGYRGADAARVVIENKVGKALSLHLSGPQNVCIELGSRERITRNLRPGVYTFQAASSGMKTRFGVRRFEARQRAVWNWGRKSPQGNHG